MTVYLKNTAGEIIGEWSSKAEAGRENGGVAGNTVARWIKKNPEIWSETVVDKTKCSKCLVTLTPQNKVSDRNQCNICINAKNRKANSKKANELSGTTRICKSCNLAGKKYKSASHLKCEDCSGKLPQISQEEYLKIHGISQRSCLICGVSKEITRFPYHFRNFRNQCKSCLNAFERWKKCRILKIERLGKETVNKHNAKVHALWRTDNEAYEEYMSFYKKSAACVVTGYCERNDSGLSRADFKKFIFDLITKNCFYCDKKPVLEDSGNGTLGEYNGVDRVDNKIGYLEDNCVPCCRTCNYMKKNMDIASFIRKCTEIAKYSGVSDINEAFDHRLKYHSDISLAGTSCDFVKYSINAERRNKDFEISEKFFDKITKRSCYLCGFSSELGVGIDRFNNEIGYTEKNCKPCCNYCNYMKRDSNYLDFLDHIKKIVDFSESSEEIKELCKKSELNPMFNSNCIYSNENIDLLDFIF